MRDNGPVYVVEDGALRVQDWDFDAWGGGFGQVAHEKDDAVPTAVGSVLGMPVDQVSIVHERGNLEFNGIDTVLLNWNVLGNPNRGNGYASKEAAELDLMKWFGVTRVVWADGPITGDDTGGHIDGIARFIDANRVVVGNCTVDGHCQPGDADDQIYDATASNLAAAGFEVIRMDFEAEISYGGKRFDADYLNWGVGNGWVILVGFCNPERDNAAKTKLEEWFPGREVHVIEMLDSWSAGGGVHRHTNDQPAASTIGAPPSTKFSAVSTTGEAPFVARFSDLSTGGAAAWEWNFGDGGSSTEQNPVHTYLLNGVYTVRLTSRGAGGSDTLMRTDYIAVPEPTARLQLILGTMGLWLSAVVRGRGRDGGVGLDAPPSSASTH